MVKYYLCLLSVNYWICDNCECSFYNSLVKIYVEVFLIGCGVGGNMGGYLLM